jgi:putative hydrolase of HD superfamily
MNINPLLLKIYEAASMQRWNDQIRTIEFTELDKQAHKMIVAYILGKCEQDHSGHEIDWIKIIETGFFDFLKRIILTDLKPPLIYKIKEDKRKYRKLNQWVFERINPYVEVLGKDFVERLREHLYSAKEDLETRIVNAAHFYITEWEFRILSQSSPPNFLFEEIDQSIKQEQEKYRGLDSRKFFHGNEKLNNFVDIAGQLRFQQRWSHLYRIPRTSVLGHMLIVAIFSYLFSYKTGSSREKRINNYFTGLFHDFPEVLTRDIIPEGWHEDIRQYTENEFSDTASRDGSLVKGADDLAAYIEAYLTLKNGIKNESLTNAMKSLRNKYRNRGIMGIDFEEIYSRLEREREVK